MPLYKSLSPHFYRVEQEVPNDLQAEQLLLGSLLANNSFFAEHVGPDSRYIHMGMTSSDVLDTSFSLQLRQSAEIMMDQILITIELPMLCDLCFIDQRSEVSTQTENAKNFASFFKSIVCFIKLTTVASCCDE